MRRASRAGRCSLRPCSPYTPTSSREARSSRAFRWEGAGPARAATSTRRRSSGGPSWTRRTRDTRDTARASSSGRSLRQNRSRCLTCCRTSCRRSCSGPLNSSQCRMRWRRSILRRRPPASSSPTSSQPPWRRRAWTTTRTRPSTTARSQIREASKRRASSWKGQTSGWRKLSCPLRDSSSGRRTPIRDLLH